jgi:hypothetical protein
VQEAAVHPPKIPRALAWGLLVFCTGFTFFGGVISETIMAGLNCRPHTDAQISGCPFPWNALALRIAPFLSAQNITDYPFILLDGFWGLILAWVAAIGLARWASKYPGKAAVLRRALAPAAISRGQVFHLFLRGGFWALLTGFIAFCIAFGTPFLGSLVAREILQAMGCTPGTFDPFTSPCMSSPGFWTPRLKPFLIPLMGQWLSPFWLVRQFGDVLILWLALTVGAYALKRHITRRTAAASS